MSFVPGHTFEVVEDEAREENAGGLRLSRSVI